MKSKEKRLRESIDISIKDLCERLPLLEPEDRLSLLFEHFEHFLCSYEDHEILSTNYGEVI